jgi:hypothetical protein
MQNILASEISLVPISLLVVQEDAATLTITRRNLEDDLSTWADDHLRRPDFDQQIVLLLRFQVGDVLGFVVTVGQPFAVTRARFVDCSEGSTEPACGNISLDTDFTTTVDSPFANGTGSPAVPV